MDIFGYNKSAWDHNVDIGNRWTVPVSPVEIESARQGDWEILLTPLRPAPRSWFPELEGCEVLGLASGGGQQGPLLAAAGARVTILDASPGQLKQDQMVAERDSLAIETVEGDMADLSSLADESFDLIVHPCSNAFVPDVLPVWREAHRVLRPGGVMLAGFCQPVLFVIDDELGERGVLELRHSIPYSDLSSITESERNRYTEKKEPLCFGHTLEDQIGGQIDAGFVVTGFFEDRFPGHALDEIIPIMAATRALKPREGTGAVG